MAETERSESPTEPIEQPPLSVDALELYEAVATGKHESLRPARVPS